MNNGSGDELAIVFAADGAFIQVFDHESAMSPYGVPEPGEWFGWSLASRDRSRAS